jgi:hypothetical protein
MENMDLFIWNLTIMYVIVVIMFFSMHFRIFYGIFIVFYQFMQNCPIRHHLLYLAITNLIMRKISACIKVPILKIMVLHHSQHV